MANKITYSRGTTYGISFSYTAPEFFGVNLIFTVKTVANDSDATDLTNAVMTPKIIAMTGDTFPQTVSFTIDPTDVSPSVLPSNSYYWSIKVFDSASQQFIAADGVFALVAYSTNETSA